MVFVIVFLVVFLVMAIVMVVSIWKIFERAGRPGWAAIVPVYNHMVMPENEQYSRYKLNRKGTFELKQPGGNHCWRMWSGSVVTWAGKVVPCCFDKDAMHSMGELSTDSFNEIWHSRNYKAFRNSILLNRQGIDICRNCSEGANVWK